MKKMILLLMLPLTALMAIEFVMTRDGLVDAENFETTTPTQPGVTAPVPSTPSTYLETVNLPACDASNPEVQFINKNSDWSKINDSSKRIFCVSPGDYSSVSNEAYESFGSTYYNVHLTTNGTEQKKRYIILNNGNDIHPGKLDKSKLAFFPTFRISSKYWVIDRYHTKKSVGFILTGAEHNILNKMLFKNFTLAIWMKNYSHNNTIQNTRFDTMSHGGASVDLSAINFNDSANKVEMFGNKIINNEFVDTKASRGNRVVGQIAFYNGTVFADNTIEISSKKRTDCKGNYISTGECVGLEAGGMSFKGGSNDINTPIILSNNKMWGHYRTDPTFANLSARGSFSLAYLGSQHIIYENNIIFNGNYGIRTGDRYDASFGSKNIITRNNIFYNLGNQAGTAPTMQYSGVNNRFENNTIINAIGQYAIISYNENLYFGNNTIINPGSIDVMYAEGIAKPKGFTTNKIYDTAAEAGFKSDYVFTTDNFTNNPRIMTLKNVVKSN